MKEIIKSELSKFSSDQLKKLALAEFLQHLILQSLYRHNLFDELTFTGGTALRLLYKTNRFSEDLDFSLHRPSHINLVKAIKDIESDIRKQGFKIEARSNNEKNIFKSDLKFPGILNEFNLSPLKDQKITIKFEVDKNPPRGGEKEAMLVSAPISYSVSIFSLTSMLATKLHAIFYRKYTKGRDFYDLIWFLGKEIYPNLTLLNNAIKQTQGEIEKINTNNFKSKLITHLEKIDFQKVKNDVERFLIDSKEAELITFDQIKSLLRNY